MKIRHALVGATATAWVATAIIAGAGSASADTASAVGDGDNGHHGGAGPVAPVTYPTMPVAPQYDPTQIPDSQKPVTPPQIHFGGGVPLKGPQKPEKGSTASVVGSESNTGPSNSTSNASVVGGSPSPDHGPDGGTEHADKPDGNGKTSVYDKPDGARNGKSAEERASEPKPSKIGGKHD